MKKVIKVISINLLLIVGLIFIIDVCTWGYQNYLMHKNNERYIGVWPIKYHPRVKHFDIDLKYFPNPDENWGRAPEGLNYKKKKPIAIFGCSYAFGYELNKEQTISYKLAHKAKRPVYNRAVSAWGIQHMLYSANQPLLYEQVPEPEYAMFIMMFDHPRRIYTRSFSPGHLLNEERYLRYKNFNGQLVQKTGIKGKSPIAAIRKLVDRSYITSVIHEAYVKNVLLSKKNSHKCVDFMVEHFIQSKNEMQKHWKNTKFIVLLYDQIDNQERFEEKLKANNIEFIELDKLVGTDLDTQEFKLEHDPHPSEKAWDLVSEKLIKELKL